MKRIALNSAMSAALILAACSDPAPQDEQLSTLPAEDVPPPQAMPSADQPSPATPPSAPVGNGVNDGYPDLTPSALTPDAERSAKGATNVLQSWARALELEEWDQAWNLLSPADRKTWSKAEWAAMFADLSKITVAFDGGQMEGAAGSSYYTAPVTITANDKDGRPVRYEGQAVLRRVNDVPGASAEQLRWHFERLTLDWTH